MADLELHAVSKRYLIPANTPPADGLFGRIKQRLSPPRADFWAVRDVNFEIARGEAVGIIGHNGAGKSTLLKLLSCITAPTLGEIRINGRIAALLEVGSGFHPELTGRENIFLSGAILGMRRSEIAAKFDRIVEFAGMSRFVDVPVKRYSSGMYVRLGFSIAAHLEPEILLLDEVLSVGDASFQEKCLTRIEELRRSGITTVFISHDLAAVRRLCSRVLLMKQGKLEGDGDSADMIMRYHEISRFQNTRTVEREITGGRAFCTGLETFGADGQAMETLASGEPVQFRLGYEVRERLEGAYFEVLIESLEGSLLFVLDSSTGTGPANVEAGKGTVNFFLESLPLRDGFYNITTVIHTLKDAEALDYQPRCTTIHVQGEHIRHGVFYTPHRCEITPA